MAVADTDVNIFDDTENSGNGGGGGGGTDVTIYSSRNTLEAEEVSPGVWDLNVKSETGRNFYVRNFHELMDAIQTIANLYIGGDTVGNVIQLLGNIDMTAPTVDDEENYVLSNGDNLIDIPNKTYNFRQYLRYTKIVSYGSKRALQLLHPNSSRTAYDTWQLNVIRFTAENLSIGGDIAAWIGEFGHGNVGRDLPCEYQRYMFSSPGNILYDIKDCYITCCGADQTIPNSFNPFLSMGSTLNAGLWVCSLNMTNCMFISGRSLTTTDPDLNAPIVINCNWYESRSKTVVLKQMSKQVNDTELDTGVPNIQIRTDNTSSATTAWSSNKWEVTTDGTALIFCVLDDCMVFAPKLALNDLYLEGTPLTPPSATPTEDKVSLVAELLKRLVLKITDMGANDALTDSDQIYFQGAANTTTDANVKRGTLSKLWTWIKSKSDSVYIPFGWINTRSYSDNIWLLHLNNRMWAWDQQFDVTWNVYNIESGDLVESKNPANLFNMQANYYNHPISGEKEVITITKKEGQRALITYGNGLVFLNFYSTKYCQSAQLRWKVENNDTWFTANFTNYHGRGCMAAEIPWGGTPNAAVYITTMEITIIGETNSDSTYKGTSVETITYLVKRDDITLDAYITKYGISQQMYGNLTAPKFIKRDGTSSQVLLANGDSATLSTAPTQSSSAPITSGGVYTALQTKLSSWEGTAQEYSDLPAAEKNLQNVLYVIK